MYNSFKVVILATILSIGWGQDLPRGYYSPRDSAWVYQMDSLFVVGNRQPGLSPIARLTIPQERIEAMAYRDLNEIITGEIPGIFGTEKGVMGYGVAGGSAGKLSLRGQGGDPTTGILIAQNGKPEIMGLMGHPVPDAYSADVVGEVEVIKGAASILYGTNALGGVVNMKTKRILTAGMNTRIRLARGDFDVKRLVLQHGGKINRWDYFLTYGQRSTAGQRPHSAFESEAYHLRLGYEVNPNLYLSLVGKSVPFHMEDPGMEGGETGLEYDITRSDVTLSARMDLSMVQLDYLVYHNEGEHEISDGFHSTDFCDGLILKHHLYPLPGNSTTIGLDYKKYGGKLIQVFKPALVGQQFDITETAFYILSEQAVNHIKLTAGARGGNHSEYGLVIVPYLGISLAVNPRLTVYSSHGTGFRSPTIRELYLFPAPNDQLKPEESVTMEIGVRYQPNVRFSLDAGYYRSSGTNRIETIGVWPNLALENCGEFKFHGFEAALKLTPVEGLQLGVNASTFTSPDPVANQPGTQVRGTISYHRKYYTLRGNIESIQMVQYFVQGSYHRLPNYTVLNLGLEVKPHKTIIVYLRGKNLADADYQTMFGYPMPGRTLEGGLILDF